MKKGLMIEKDMETLETFVRLFNSLEEAQKAIEKQIASGVLEEKNGCYEGLGVTVRLIEVEAS